MVSRQPISHPLLIVPTALIATCLVLGCGKRAAQDGGNTNWLSTCDVSADCEGQGACICGLCTSTCDSDADCFRGGRSASCVDPVSASESGGCAAVVKDAEERICLPDCSATEDCGENSTCINRACWPNTDGIVDERIRTDASSPLYPVDLNEEMDFTHALSLPDPEIAITGDFDPSMLLGVWEGNRTEWGYLDYSIELTLKIDAVSKKLIGFIKFFCPECNDELPPAESFDAERARERVLYSFDYRIFDGRVEGQHFSFWITSNDFWRDWCPLQTSYPVQINGRSEHHCIPDPQLYHDVFSLHSTDLGDENAIEFLCSADRSVCQCDPDGCDINYRAYVNSFDGLLDDEVMHGTFVESYDSDTWRMILNRVADN